MILLYFWLFLSKTAKHNVHFLQNCIKSRLSLPAYDLIPVLGAVAVWVPSHALTTVCTLHEFTWKLQFYCNTITICKYCCHYTGHVMFYNILLLLGLQSCLKTLYNIFLVKNCFFFKRTEPLVRLKSRCRRVVLNKSILTHTQLLAFFFNG